MLGAGALARAASVVRCWFGQVCTVAWRYGQVRTVQMWVTCLFPLFPPPPPPALLLAGGMGVLPYAQPHDSATPLHLSPDVAPRTWDLEPDDQGGCDCSPTPKCSTLSLTSR